MTLVYVVAFDPGETIGWAVMGVDTINLTDVNTRELHDAIHTCGEWRWGQIDTRALGSADAGIGVNRGHAALNLVGENAGVVQMLDLTCGEYPKSAVCLEKFVLDPKHATGNFNLLSAVRIISAFSFGLDVDWRNDSGDSQLSRVYLIQRGDPKRTCTNERMKHWGFKAVVSHATRHACDASRIAYYFLRDCRGQSEKAQEARWQAWPHFFPDPQNRRVPKKPKSSLGERI